MSELTKSPDDVLHPALEPPPVNHEDAPRSRVDKVVFGVAAGVAIAFVLWGALSTESLSTSASAGLEFVVHNTGWLFSLVASGFVVFVIWLAASKYGNIPLGGDGEAPEFRTSSWVAMMFSAGMGIGLMFYGVTEPLTHFVKPPPGTGAAGNPAAVQTAMATTMFHWSLHPWAVYAVFRKGRSLLISSAFAPLFGEKRANGPAGRVIDIFAIFATLFGSATSLGLGALQIGSGLQIVTGIGKVGNAVLIAIIVVLTVCFILSAVSGVAKGIQWLSNINMVLALALALFVFVVGPTVFILNLVPTTIGQFVSGVLLVPSVVSLIWFAIFGGAGIAQQQGGKDIAAQSSPEGSLFAMLGNLPWPTVTAIVVMLLVAIFFVSGADAASIVMGTLSEKGTLEPSKKTVIFWGAATGAVAAIMLLFGGEDALSGLQNVTIVAALPFLVIMIGLAVALVKDLSRDPQVVRRQYAVAAVEHAVVAGVSEHGDDFSLTVQETAPGEGV